MEVRFVILAPSKSRKPHAAQLPVVIGRGDEAKLRIQQDSVSRRHCEFARDGDVVTVTDLGSTNGTLVGGKRIEPHVATPVSSGAEVRVGTAVLRIEYAVAAAVSSDADTMPLEGSPDAAAEPAQPEPVAAAAPEPAAEAAAPAEPEPVAAPAAEDLAFPDPEPVADAGDLAALAGAEPAPPPPDGSFDFLGAEAASPPAADDKLDDFFKSLS